MLTKCRQHTRVGIYILIGIENALDFKVELLTFT